MVEKGTEIDFTLEATDQYGDPFTGPVEWSINGTTLKSGHYVAETRATVRLQPSRVPLPPLASFL